jgi:hypothetical protein
MPPSSRCGNPDWDGQSFELDDSRIPAPISAAASALSQPGYELYFVDTAQGGEWWLMDGDNMVDAFWLKKIIPHHG